MLNNKQCALLVRPCLLTIIHIMFFAQTTHVKQQTIPAQNVVHVTCKKHYTYMHHATCM